MSSFCAALTEEVEDDIVDELAPAGVGVAVCAALAADEEIVADEEVATADGDAGTAWMLVLPDDPS